MMMVVSGAPAAERSSAMLTGGLTSQPIGHYEFCKANPAECSIKLRDPGPLHLTEAAWKEIDSVNTLVNTSVKAMSDLDHYGKDEVWAYPDDGYGDCEDYALEKRRKLSQEGISLSDLLITVVRKPDGEGHAVLTVRTDQGDYILDNLSETVKPWEATGYRYLKRQSTNHTGRWVSIREDSAPLVGSVQ
ncbi:transglutaminase-like cysteine peptidase [Mesorhizobium sp. BAC0120]|nr:transglutaminase-like cysteine peptidase [Mesorhizobium sp. BAC0120]MDW6024562.1 transglutaminase-like cysteine peptidase [Mesorhizobium sp. BAC0120]